MLKCKGIDHDSTLLAWYGRPDERRDVWNALSLVDEARTLLARTWGRASYRAALACCGRAWQEVAEELELARRLLQRAEDLLEDIEE